MGGKRPEADQISKWIGGLGEVEENGQLISPPFYYFVYKAAKILGCSYLELDAREDKTELMKMAFTIDYGERVGEQMKELNPVYRKKCAEFSNKITAAQKRVQ